MLRVAPWEPRSVDGFRIDCKSSLAFDRIVTIRSTSASDIETMLGVPGSHVVPIHGGASGYFRPRPSGSPEFADEFAAFFPEIAEK